MRPTQKLIGEIAITAYVDDNGLRSYGLTQSGLDEQELADYLYSALHNHELFCDAGLRPVPIKGRALSVCKG